MLVTIEGTYDKGKILLKETPVGLADKSEVLITFLPKASQATGRKRQLGSWSGKYKIPDDFNEPIEDLKEYM